MAEAVAALSHRALSVSEPDELLCESLQVAVEVTDADYGTAVRRLSDDRLRVAKELGPDPMAPGSILPLSSERSYVLRVIETGQPFVSADLRRDSRVSPPDLLLRRGVVSGLAVPVRGTEQVLGVLAVHSRRRRRFSRYDVAAASALASVVAAAWEQARTRERLSHLALHDHLTGLPNRALFFDRLNAALARRPSTDDTDTAAHAAVMLIDLDEFKKANDRFGHAAGDQILKVAAQRLQGAVRPQDTIARLGGDEFGLLCESIPDEETAVALARRMQAACTQPVQVGGAELTITASYGISWGTNAAVQPRTAAMLLSEADAALYRAKARGHGQIQVFDDRLKRSTRRRRQLESSLRAGLDRGEFRLHYQPVRRAGDLHVVGVEALVRWQHPTRGLLLPDDFIPTAEVTGVITPLGEWVLRTACRQAASWQRERVRAGDALWVAVNVSPRQLDDARLPDTVADVLRETALVEGTLVLELTESALMPSDDTRRDVLTRLRAAGARLFLDDFGTGYSSLTHLTQLPIQAVKIDRSFVDGLPVNRRNAAVVSSLITLSDELDLEVIAEGVETPQQLHALQDMHCQSVQGYLLDQPTEDPALGSS